MPVELVVLREDTGGDGMEEHGIIVTPEIVEVATPYGPSEKIGRVGVVAGAREILNIGPGAAAYYGVTDSWRMTVGVFNGMMDIVVGRRSKTGRAWCRDRGVSTCSCRGWPAP